MLLITTKAKMIELHPEWGIEGIAKAYELLSEFQTVFNARYEYFERDDDTARKLWNNEFHTRWMNLVRENTERTCNRKWKSKSDRMLPELLLISLLCLAREMRKLQSSTAQAELNSRNSRKGVHQGRQPWC